MHLYFFQNRAFTESAFTAFERTTEFVSYEEGEVLRFTDPVLNIGNDYNGSTSTYTCPLNGLYFFRFVILFDIHVLVLAKMLHILLSQVCDDFKF